jgi:hypothetical protein
MVPTISSGLWLVPLSMSATLSCVGSMMGSPSVSRFLKDLLEPSGVWLNSRGCGSHQKSGLFSSAVSGLISAATSSSTIAFGWILASYM